jgi:23S rRNA pseudouridine1911/1915/1917 synthase
LRLDAFLASLITDHSRGEIQGWIRDGRVTIGGSTATSASLRLRDACEIAVDVPETISEAARPVDLPINVAFEDEHLLVIDKPAGLTVHPGAGHNNDTLVNGLLHHYPEIAEVGEPDRPGIVHRLDRDTSGLMVVARTAASYSRLSEMVRDHEVTRIYTALVLGHVEPNAGIIDAPIGRDSRLPMRMAASRDGREARTKYEVVEQFGSSALLKVELETGRTHQIRVHLESIGFPVAGDPTYGKPAFELERQFLHASQLLFTHPITGEEITVESELPRDLVAALALAHAA